MPTFNSTSKLKTFWLPALLTLLVMTAMVFASEALSEREIIFPEIAAIATGCLLAPSLSWRVSKVRILILITGGAFIGLGIVLFVPLPLWQQAVLAFALSQVIYVLSGTTMAPMVSAIVLPVILQTRSLTYPISAFLLTGVILLLRTLLERAGIRPKESFVPFPLPGRRTWMDVTLRIVLMALVSYPAIRYGWTFVCAPPLLVAFTEFTNRKSPLRKKPISAILFITMSALAGASMRILLVRRLGLSLTLAALCAGILFILLVYIYGLYIPPAGAACILAMLVPEGRLVLYPVMIALGASIFMACSLLLFRTPKKS